MARSLKVAPRYIEKVKSAVQRNGYPSQQVLASEVGLSLSTVKNFLNSKPVDYLNFLELSKKLGLDWQKIAYQEPSVQADSETIIELIEEPSPFITGTPITHPHQFFGREKEIKRIFNLLKRHPLQNAVIIGKQRIGKTSLLHYLKNITTTSSAQLRPTQKSDWLPNPETYKWIFVDFQDVRMQSREGLLGYILESLNLMSNIPRRDSSFQQDNSESIDLDLFMDAVSHNLHNPTVILLDEIGVGLQRCPELNDEFWESLRSLATNHTNGNLAFILATNQSPIELAHKNGHSSPFFNIFGYTAYLGSLTEIEARELIASSPIAFSQEDVEWILHQSCCLPLLLQILCRERLFSLEEVPNNSSWREEALKQIEPFQELIF
ncbi:MAG: ATP-binding protein [Hapalosiphonaceae cyanobacterium JJU2]|nr:MAG: ATP-binding protein [Hapalosiphonaceae cyanobacterium JJU2]